MQVKHMRFLIDVVVLLIVCDIFSRIHVELANRHFCHCNVIVEPLAEELW